MEFELKLCYRNGRRVRVAAGGYTGFPKLVGSYSHVLHMPGGCGQMFWAPRRCCGAECDALSCLCKAGRAETHAIRRAVGEAPKAISAQIVRPLIVAPWQVSRLQKNVFGMRPRGDKLHKNLQRPRCCQHLVNACFCCQVVSAWGHAKRVAPAPNVAMCSLEERQLR